MLQAYPDQMQPLFLAPHTSPDTAFIPTTSTEVKYTEMGPARFPRISLWLTGSPHSPLPVLKRLTTTPVRDAG